MAGVELRAVAKRYPDAKRPALHALSLDIADGEFMVFVGPSGCGKSTLLRLLAGLEQPSGGEIYIGGRAVNGLPPQRRNVAMVFQNYALYPHMTVRQNIAFPLRMMRVGRGEAQRRVAGVAALLGLEALLEQRPAALSGGQRQRVAMARALVRDPAVFLMDEPLSNLDARLRVQIRAEIQALQRRTATTTAYVTHDQVEAMTLGQRVAVLDGGVLQQLATPQVLYDAPVNTFVAGFLGSPSMNLFPARLSHQDGRWLLIAAGQRLAIPQAVARRWPGLAAGDDVTVTAGLRPESLRRAAAGTPGPLLQSVAEGVENLGHETLLFCRVGPAAGGFSIAARCPPGTSAAPGEHTAISVDLHGLHLFGGDGRALPRRPSTPPPGRAMMAP